MKTYTLFLDILIMSLLALAVHFYITDDIIVKSRITRSGFERTMIISWQSLFVIASFCVFLRYIVRNVRTAV
jgi:hypothetical protein